MQSLKATHSDFAFDVSIVLADAIQIQKNTASLANVSLNWRPLVKNSCFLHEYSLLTKNQRRRCISNNSHIFAAMMTACVEEAKAALGDCD